MANNKKQNVDAEVIEEKKEEVIQEEPKKESKKLFSSDKQYTGGTRLS